MRYSITIAALAAIGAQAVPQASYSVVQPISQISDGQIQAPPATSVPAVPVPSGPAVPSQTPEVPPVSPPVAPSVIPSVPAAPSVVVPSVVVPVPVPGNSSVVVPSGTGTFPNSSVTVTTGAPSGTPTGGAPAPPENSGAAAVNMVSFGGLALALFAYLA